MDPIAYMVVCIDDDGPDRTGTYCAATHGTFASRQEAETYAAMVAVSRRPIVVSLYKRIRF